MAKKASASVPELAAYNAAKKAVDNLAKELKDKADALDKAREAAQTADDYKALKVATEELKKSRAKVATAAEDLNSARDAARTALEAYIADLKAQQAQEKEKAQATQQAAPSALPPGVFPDSIAGSGMKVVSDKIGGSTGAKLVEIDGRRYILKQNRTAAGVYRDGQPSPEHVRNEAAADQAYRRAGIRVPDCRIYEEDGVTYKLAEFIPGGQSLGSYLDKATPAQRQAVIDELKQGYIVDSLFANWDVLGTGQDNVLVDKDGHAWRIDNGSSFGFRAMGEKKKPGEFDNRDWPDDWRTLRDSSINSGVFDKLTAHDIFSSKVDLDAVVSGLPDETKKALAKPLEELKQMQSRCADFDRGGYMPESSSFVLESTYDLSKESFREEVPKKIDLHHFGFCRSSGFAGQQNPGGLPDYSTIIKAAAISINKHTGFGKGAADYKPNADSVKAALDLKPDLQKYAKTDPNAKTLLGLVTEIEKAQAAGWHIKSKFPNVPDLTVTPPGVAATPKKYKSLTDHLYDYAQRQGVDCGLAADYFGNQGSNSWDHRRPENNACRLKVLNLALRGIDASKIKGDDPIVYMGGYDGQGAICDEIKRAIEFYKQNPDQLEADKKSLLMWKSATQLLLENASFDGNRPSDHFMYHMRTDAKKFFGKSVKDGVVRAPYAIGASESGCPIQSKAVYSGGYVGVRRVPFSRVNAIFFMDPRPNGGGSMFLGDGERECGADLTGLPVYTAGDYGDGFAIKDHIAEVDAAFAAWDAANP